ncbi:MAG TPA: hypothetical protein VF215_17435, partial [Thermoanaerobaculia bacterium]
LRKSGGAGSTTFTNVALASTGTIHVQSGMLNPANASVSGTLDLDAGTKLVIDSDTFTFSGATTLPDSGTVELQAGTLMVSSNVTVPALIFNNGVLDGASTLTLGGTASWGGGTMQGGGATEVANLATLTMTGVAKALNTRTLRPLSGSTVNWTAGNLTANTGGNIDNSGLFSVSFDANIGNAGSAGGFVNNNGGTLRKSTTTGSFTLTNINLTNNGILDIDLGKVDVTGTFSQGATGSLDILLGGVLPGTQHGQLVTNSGPSLAGALNITFNGPYQPLVNDDFVVVSWPSDTHVGNFSPYNLPALANGRTWSSLFNATGLHLTVNGGDADLSIGKTASSANVVVSNPITYTLAISNAGPDAANSVQVTDTLPAGHTGISASGSGWTCNVVSLTVTCSVASLAVGVAPNITINATAPSTPQTFINTASVTTTSPDPGGANNSGNATVTVNASSADVELLVLGPATPLAPLTPFQLDFEVRNNGPQPATSVAFSAPIPSALTFNAVTPAACSFAAGTISCALSTIASGNSVHVVVDLTTTSTAGTHTVTGTGSAAEGDPLPLNNSIAASVQITGGSITVTNNNDSGPGSLRQALLDAQSSVCTFPCTIAFNIAAPPFKIMPATALPNVASNTTIDGTTQPGYAGTPLIEVDGSSVPTAPGTFVLNGASSTLKGLALTNATATTPAVLLSGSTNAVIASYIGVAPGGAAAGNGTGIRIQGNNNTIGGANATDANTIANNSTNGIAVASGIGNAFLRNSIANNTLLGIDLGIDGATPNIAGDADTGANNLQNSPTLTAATLDGVGGMTITANIDSSSTTAGSILLEFFEADASGEGNTFISYACVAGNAFGLGSSFAAPAFISAGDSIVATATAYSDGACTSVADGTSEFSNVVLTTLCTPPPATLNAPASVCASATNVAANVVAPTATSFNWSATGATIASGQGTNAITFNAAASGSVMLSVTVTDGVGCTNTVSTTFPINPNPVVNIAGPTATCAGTPVTLDAGPGFSSYIWSTSETTSSIIVTPGSTQTYSVTVTDANGCTASDSHVVTVSSNPTATIAAPAAICANAAGAASVATQAGATYAWTITNGTLTSSAAAANITFTAGPSGNVGLAVTVTAGSCTSNGSAT